MADLAQRVHNSFAHPTPTATPDIATLPQRSKDIFKKQHDTAVARGATGEIAQKYVPYTKVTSPATTPKTGAAPASAPTGATVSPDSFPTGCGLFITEYFRGGPRQIEADSLTDCNFAVEEIDQYIGTAVGTSMGFAQINSTDNEVYNTGSDTLNLFTSCSSYPSANDYDSSVSGDLFFYDGSEYTADAYDDELRGIRC